MQPFRFRLEALLRVRRAREREALRDVVTKRAEIAALTRANAEAQAAMEGERTALLDLQAQPVFELAALLRGRAFIAHLRRTMLQRDALRAQRERELQALLHAYASARAAARAVEKLREKRHAQWLRERGRAEQYAADELAQQMHGMQHAPP